MLQHTSLPVKLVRHSSALRLAMWAATAARVACACETEAWLPDFVRAVYRANFAADLEISERSVVADCVAVAGGEPEHALSRADSDEVKARLRAQTEHAAALGIFGAPSFVVDGELFWGNDRLEQALAWARQRA